MRFSTGWLEAARRRLIEQPERIHQHPPQRRAEQAASFTVTPYGPRPDRHA